MSEYITKLECYADLDVSIIRATKINKVPKAILKLENIPMESEFHFKDRSRQLLEKWNKILESAAPPAETGPTKNDTSAVSVTQNGAITAEEPATTGEKAEDKATSDETGASADIASTDDQKVQAASETHAEETQVNFHSGSHMKTISYTDSI